MLGGVGRGKGVVVCVRMCVYTVTLGGVAGRWVCTPSWRCISFACGTCVEADKTIPSVPEPRAQSPPSCLLLVVATGDDPC